MSLEWPDVTLDQRALAALPASHTPSPLLRRACKRYIMALHNLNKQLVAYNMDVLLRQLQSVSSHEELRDIMGQCELVPFASVPVPSLSGTLPALITLHRAFQCLRLLKDTLNSWVPGSDEDAQPASAGLFPPG